MMSEGRQFGGLATRASRRASLPPLHPLCAPHQLLTGLVSMALATEQLQGDITERADELGAASARRDGGVADEDSDDEAFPPSPSVAAAAAAAADGGWGAGGGAAGSSDASGSGSALLDAWGAWLEAWRLGLRRPLGRDMRGRRYWCLGRRAGAFRVFVEEGKDGELWGWYEGAD